MPHESCINRERQNLIWHGENEELPSPLRGVKAAQIAIRHEVGRGAVKRR